MLAALLLVPLTFQFFGTWERSTEPGEITGVEIQAGDPFAGSFTFERLENGTVLGDLSFSLGSLEFLPLWLVEYPDGWGSMAGKTDDLACLLPSTGEATACYVSLAFTGPQNTGCGGLGLDCHSARLWVYDPSRLWSTGVNWSRDVSLTPFLPFQVYDAYVVPEPATIVLVGSGLLALLWRRRRH